MSQQAQTELQEFLNGPAGPPPAGILSTFDNPPNLNVYFTITYALCLTLASLAVFIRMFTKLALLRSVGYEDYLSVLSLIGLVASVALGSLAQRRGLGIHTWNIRLGTFARLLYWENAMSIVYCLNICFVKLSILLQYQRIFVTSRTRKSPVYVVIQSCIWIISLFYLIEFFLAIFQCIPRETIWNPLETKGYCINMGIFFKSSGLFNIISDFALLSIPMPLLWKLQMCLKRKLLTMGVFAIGILACVASIMRTYYTWNAVKSIDASYTEVPFILCTSIEISIGIIVGCLPVMPKFFHHISVGVSKALSSASKSTIKPGLESKGTSNGPGAPKAHALINIKRPFTTHMAARNVSESWGDPCSPHARPHGEYLTLPDFDLSLLRATNSSQPQPLGGGTATRREDLEYGQCTGESYVR